MFVGHPLAPKRRLTPPQRTAAAAAAVAEALVG